jgi:uncharacterized membrane protein
MSRLGRFWLAMTLVAAAFATSLALYARLPAIIPTHWNAAGVIDGWMRKSSGAFVVPGVSLVIVACLILLEPIRIQEDGGDLNVRYYPIIVAGVAAVCFFANLWVLAVAMGWHLS